MNILFLNAGRRCELIDAFRSALKKHGGGKLFATDISDLAPALFKVDYAERFPHSSTSEFVNRLASFCNDHHIDLVIPTIDPDLEMLSQKYSEIMALCPQTKILISPAETIQCCRDKRLSWQQFRELGIQVPEQLKISDDLSFPLFVKPAGGSAGIGAKIIHDQEELMNAVHHQKNLIIEEFIDGPEYTVDVLCDFQSKPLISVARRRIKVRAGEVNQGVVDMNSDVLRLAEKAAKGFGCQGPVTVQFRKKSDGKFVAIELNARMGGGLPLAIAAGADWPSYIISLIKEQCPSVNNQIKNGLMMSRYDNAVYFQHVNFPVKAPHKPEVKKNVSFERKTIHAVIFDMDDTLFPEREFVFSGYRAVAAKVYQDFAVDIEPELQYLFTKGKRGDLFTEVLRQKGVKTDESYILTLVDCYRKHSPAIKPYLDVIPFLKLLKDNHIKIGLITDGWSAVQHNKFDALNLKQYFDSVIISDDLGGRNCWKPSIQPYQKTLEKLDVNAENSLFIGDNPEKDFIACNKLGLYSTRIRRPLTEHCYSEPESSCAAANTEITTLTEIIIT